MASGNSSVPSGNKPLSDPMLMQNCDAIFDADLWCHIELSQTLKTNGLSIWQLCCDWWRCKLSFWQLTVQTVMTKLSNWRPFVFSEPQLLVMSTWTVMSLFYMDFRCIDIFFYVKLILLSPCRFIVKFQHRLTPFTPMDYTNILTCDARHIVPSFLVLKIPDIRISYILPGRWKTGSVP